MPKPPRSDVEKAIERLRRFHRIGRDSLKHRDDRGAYGQRHVETQAERLRMNPDLLRKLRQFADPEAGYVQAELNELCRLCRKHGRHWGIKCLAVIVRVPKSGGQRSEVQRQAIEGGWTTARLTTEVRRRIGRRRAGGRKPAVLPDVEGVLCQLEAWCESWTRLYAELKADAEPRAAHPRLRDLPPAVRQGIRAAAEAIGLLQSSLNRKLDVYRKEAGPQNR